MGMFDIDLRGIEPSVALTPVPDGWYKVIIVKSNIKQTAKGDGGYLELIHQIIEGQFVGRNVYWNLNLFNPSQAATDIAHKQLSAIGHCIGQHRVYDQAVPDNATPMLHNQPYLIWVVVAQGNQGPINNVKGCKDINGNDPGRQAHGAAAPMTAPAGSWPAPQPHSAAPVGGMQPGGWSGAPAQPTQPAPPAWPQQGQPAQPPAPPPAAPPAWPQPQPGPAPGAPPAWAPNQPPPAAPPPGPPPGTPGSAPAWGGPPQPTGPAPSGPPAAWQQAPGGAPAVAPWGQPK